MRPLCEFKLKDWKEPCGKPTVGFWSMIPGNWDFDGSGKLYNWSAERRWFCSVHYDWYVKWSSVFPGLSNYEAK